MSTYRVEIPYTFYREIEVEAADDLVATLLALEGAPEAVTLLGEKAVECLRAETLYRVKVNKVTN